MKKAIEQAEEAYSMLEVPIGAIIVDNENNIISANYNKVILMNDPTAHAEILCIREACKKLKKNNLKGCSIYITLEPCSMCASAISKSQLKNIFMVQVIQNLVALNMEQKFFLTLKLILNRIFIVVSKKKKLDN